MSKPVEKIARDLDYQTPERILACVRAYAGGTIALDPATCAGNPTGARRFFTPAEDGILQDWAEAAAGGVVFVNPPFGIEMKLWLAKAQSEAASRVEVVMLLPVNRFEQGYLQEFLASGNMLLLIRKRVAFLRPTTGEVAKGNPYASMIVGLNVNQERFRASFAPLGLCLKIGI